MVVEVGRRVVSGIPFEVVPNSPANVKSTILLILFMFIMESLQPLIIASSKLLASHSKLHITSAIYRPGPVFWICIVRNTRNYATIIMSFYKLINAFKYIGFTFILDFALNIVILMVQQTIQT